MNLEQVLQLYPLQSPTITKYNESFLAAKDKFTSLKKSAEANFSNTKYNYAKIEDIYESVQSHLNKNSLYITHQVIALQKDLEILITTIMHVSGEFMRDIRFVVSDKPGNQGKGIANTYCRKYAILCLCSLSTFDDDAEGEEEYLKNLIDEDQIELIRIWSKNEIYRLNHGQTLDKFILDRFKIKSFDKLTNSDFVKIKKYIDDRDQEIKEKDNKIEKEAKNEHK